MDRPSSPSYRERRGPHIYVHLEVGISWNSKKEPKNHEVTYGSRESRAVREKELCPGSKLPRQMSSPDPTYLAAIHDFEQRQSRTREKRKTARPLPQINPAASIPDTRMGAHHQMQEYYQVPGYYGPAQHATTSRQQQRRRSRSGSKSAGERGHSAPPHNGDNPWDIEWTGYQAEGPSDSRPDVSSRPPSNVWKALPAPPNQFRLGEAGMPWSSPMTFETGAGSQHDDSSDLPSAHHRPDRIPTFHPDDEASIYEASPVTGISVFSPGPSHSQARGDADPSSVRDLEELSAAMVTVDNGFENQWWNQGQRRSVLFPTSVEEPPSVSRTTSARSLGWAVAKQNIPPRGEIHSVPNTSLGVSDMVSPVSEYSTLAFSPPQAHHSLHRSMSTRSEEMWLTNRDF